MNEDKIDFNDLDLTFGQLVETLPQDGEGKQFFDTVLLGMIPGESLVIGAPESGIFPNIREGDKLIFRIKLADGIALFGAYVLYISDVPLYMVYVDFPRDVAFKRIRNARRVSVTLPILVSNLSSGDQTAIGGRITDISTTGAGLQLTEKLGDVGDEVNMKGKFTVGDIQRLLSIRGVIRVSKQVAVDQFIYGLEFLKDDENDLLVLFGFIFNAMAFGKIEKIR